MPDPDTKRRSTDVLPFNGRIERARAYVKLLSDLGMGPLVVLIILGMVTGYVKSPITEIQAEARVHEAGLKQAVTSRIVRDERVIEVLTRLAERMDKQDRRVQFRECQEIKDVELRRECLRP